MGSHDKTTTPESKIKPYTLFIFAIFFMLFSFFLFAQRVTYTCKLTSLHKRTATYTDIKTDSIICTSCEVETNIWETLQTNPQTLATIARFPNENAKMGFYLCLFVSFACFLATLILFLNPPFHGF